MNIPMTYDEILQEPTEPSDATPEPGAGGEQKDGRNLKSSALMSAVSISDAFDKTLTNIMYLDTNSISFIDLFQRYRYLFRYVLGFFRSLSIWYHQTHLSALRGPLRKALLRHGLKCILCCGIGEGSMPKPLRQTDPACLQIGLANQKLIYLKECLEAARDRKRNEVRLKESIELELRRVCLELAREKDRTLELQQRIVKSASTVHAALDRLTLRCDAHEKALRSMIPGASGDHGRRDGKGTELQELIIGMDPERALRNALSEAISLRQEMFTNSDTIRKLIQELWMKEQQQPSGMSGYDPARGYTVDYQPLAFHGKDAAFTANNHALRQGNGADLNSWERRAVPLANLDMQAPRKPTARLLLSGNDETLMHGIMSAIWTKEAQPGQEQRMHPRDESLHNLMRSAEDAWNTALRK